MAYKHFSIKWCHFYNYFQYDLLLAVPAISNFNLPSSMRAYYFCFLVALAFPLNFSQGFLVVVFFFLVSSVKSNTWLFLVTKVIVVLTPIPHVTDFLKMSFEITMSSICLCSMVLWLHQLGRNSVWLISYVPRYSPTE